MIAATMAMPAVLPPPRRAPRWSPSWRRAVAVGTGSFAIARVATELVALIAAYGSSFVTVVRHNPQAALTVWEQWDARYYLRIADSGYTTPRLAAFPPLPSALISAIHHVTHVEPLVAGLALSFIAGGVACALLVRLVELDFDQRTSALTVFLLLTFPTALFLQSVYAEGLLLMLSVAAFLALRRGRPVVAGALIALAVLTKTYAVALAIPLAWEYLDTHGWTLDRVVRAAAHLFLPPLVALAAWMLFLGRALGDPLLVVTAERFWGRTFTPPWVAISQGVRNIYGAHLVEGVDLVAVFMLAAAAVYAWRRVRRSYAVLLAVSALVFSTAGTLMSAGRFTIVAFPLFIVAAALAARRPWLERLWAAAFIPLGVYFLAAFATGRWAG